MHVGIKHHTAAIQKSIETGHRFPLSHFDSRRYIQHNLAIGDGLGSLLEFLDQLPAGTSRVNPLRTFEDGDLSFAHLEYFLAPLGSVVGFEVHRWEDGRIVEHWDNLQQLPDGLNPSGRTMIDGPTDTADLDSTAQNKTLVETFARRVLIDRAHDLLPQFVSADQFIQHNPRWGDGIDELRRMLAATDEAVVYDHLHHILGEGNFCLTISEGTAAGRQSAFYDLFRIDRGRVVEHWDVVEQIPPRDQWKNDNGKF